MTFHRWPYMIATAHAQHNTAILIMATTSKEDLEELSIEQTLSNLETILQRMESEEQPLEASLADFEEGIRLTRQAQKMLQEAEQKVQLLTETSDGGPQASQMATTVDDAEQ